MNKNIAVQKVQALDAAVRQWMQQVFGRELKEDDEITILVRDADAGDRLRRVMDKAAAKAEHIPDDELEELIAEATEAVRYGKA